MAHASTRPVRGELIQPAYSPQKLVGFILGPLVFAIMLLIPAPAGMSPEAMRVAATTLWMAIWWITEAMPIPVTSLLPLVLLPLTGALTAAQASAGYSNTLIFVFIGGFMIALALERWNLHRRIALYIITVVGCSPTRIILGFMAATGFLSMWISNTATAMMMMPMGAAVIAQMSSLLSNARNPGADGAQGGKGFGTALMLGIAYAASIGGIATLVGTPPNIVLAGAAQELAGVEVTFAKWMMIGLPLSLIGLAATWFYLTQIAYRTSNKAIPGGLDVIKGELRNLGPMSSSERWVLLVFGLVAFAWITQPWLIEPIFPKVNDAVIAILGALVLFAIPARRADGKPTFLLDWESAVRLPWGIVLLFGGGLAIADAFKSTGLTVWLGESLTAFGGLPSLLVLLVVVTMVIFLTEVTSNTASATMLMPVMAALALGLGINPLLLMAPTAIAASCAFMLPVATPPNAIVFGTGQVTISEMARAGLWLNLGGIVLITAVCYWLMPILWGLGG